MPGAVAGAGDKRMFAVLDALEARLRGTPTIDVTPKPEPVMIEKPSETPVGMTMAERLAQRTSKNNC